MDNAIDTLFKRIYPVTNELKTHHHKDIPWYGQGGICPVIWPHTTVYYRATDGYKLPKHRKYHLKYVVGH